MKEGKAIHFRNKGIKYTSASIWVRRNSYSNWLLEHFMKFNLIQVMFCEIIQFILRSKDSFWFLFLVVLFDWFWNDRLNERLFQACTKVVQLLNIFRFYSKWWLENVCIVLWHCIIGPRITLFKAEIISLKYFNSK